MCCPKCGAGLRQFVDMTVECDAGYPALNKRGLRRRDVTIWGVNWAGSRWFCKCGGFADALGIQEEKQKEESK